MTIVYGYPKTALLNRFLPKNKIFEFAKPTQKIKNLFVQQVNKITLQYSLSSRSINLAATPVVPEIQIFHIELKTPDLNLEVLSCIDKAIPFPILFELHHNNKVKITAAFKRPNEADSSKWVISGYYQTGWFEENTPREALPIALDMAGLYEKLLAPLMPRQSRVGEDLSHYVTRMDQLQIKQRELEKTQARLSREKQFNRKATINAELRKIKQDIQRLADA